MCVAGWQFIFGVDDEMNMSVSKVRLPQIRSIKACAISSPLKLPANSGGLYIRLICQLFSSIYFASAHYMSSSWNWAKISNNKKNKKKNTEKIHRNEKKISSANICNHTNDLLKPFKWSGTVFLFFVFFFSVDIAALYNKRRISEEKKWTHKPCTYAGFCNYFA